MTTPVKHLRSAIVNRRPTASGIANGRLAINTASGSPGLYFADSASGVVKVGPAHVGPTAPNATPSGSSGNSLGELWVNNATTIHGLNYYTGSAFVNLTPSGTVTAAGLVELATPAETQTGTDGIRAVTPSGLQSKISDSTSTTSSTTIASATAVKAAYDLADAALPKAGGIITGEIVIAPSGSLAFEGSTDNSFETRIVVVDPTAARVITLPNVTGTVITTGDTGTVTSTMLAGSIATSKLASGALPSGVTVSSGNIVDGTIGNAEINASAGIVYSKLELTNSIVNADISASGAIAFSKLATGALPTAITVSSGNIVDGTIGNAEINANAGIVDTKLATISTAGKVANSATTATNANTPSGIVARDASGNFSAGTITAALTGAASSNVLKAGDTMTGTLTISNTVPAIRLAESDGTSTHAQNLLLRDSNLFQIQLRDSSGVFVSSDYSLASNASGATTHTWSTQGTSRLTLNSTGLLALTASAGLSISSTGVTAPAAADGNVFSGTYTPTVSGIANVTALVEGANQYMRVGNVVTVSGRITIDANVVSPITDTSFRMTLPIASNFGAARQCAGTGACVQGGLFGETIGIIADTVNKEAEFRLRPTNGSSNIYNFSFTYLIV